MATQEQQRVDLEFRQTLASPQPFRNEPSSRQAIEGQRKAGWKG